MSKNNSEKSSCFLNNCILIDSIKLSLLRKEHLSLEFNVLRNSPKILHMTKRAFFFQLNFLHRDQ